MLTILGVVLSLFIVALVIFRLFKYRFKRFNRENLGLVIIAGIVVLITDIPSFWNFVLIILIAFVLLVLCIGMKKIE
ncbi:hypothetical protein D3C76_245660 [compost metagenome]